MTDTKDIKPDTSLYTDPAAEKVIDIGLWFENRQRYIEQSAATKDNDRAEIPPRAAAR